MFCFINANKQSSAKNLRGGKVYVGVCFLSVLWRSVSHGPKRKKKSNFLSPLWEEKGFVAYVQKAIA